MNKIFLFVGLISLLGCDSNSKDIIQDKTESVSNEEPHSKSKVDIDSSVFRLESLVNESRLILYAKLHFTSSIPDLKYVNLNISFTDDYEKTWFSEDIQIKDSQCGFNGWCDSLTYEISFDKNKHEYGTFDLEIMNNPQFEKYQSEFYNNIKVNLQTEGGVGYERILIPDAEVKIINYK